MKFKFVGDKKGDNPENAVIHSRVSDKRYAFRLNGAGVEVDGEDIEMFKAHHHFVEVREYKKKKKTSKKVK